MEGSQAPLRVSNPKITPAPRVRIAWLLIAFSQTSSVPGGGRNDQEGRQKDGPLLPPGVFREGHENCGAAMNDEGHAA